MAVPACGPRTRDGVAGSGGVRQAEVPRVARERPDQYGRPSRTRWQARCRCCGSTPRLSCPWPGAQRTAPLRGGCPHGGGRACGTPAVGFLGGRASGATVRRGCQHGRGRAPGGVERADLKWAVVAQALSGWVRAHHRPLLALPWAPRGCRAAPLEPWRAARTRRLPASSAVPPTPPPAASGQPPHVPDSDAEPTAAPPCPVRGRSRGWAPCPAAIHAVGNGWTRRGGSSWHAWGPPPAWPPGAG
jgi:hypothetical protein